MAQRKGWRGIGYHKVILRDGTIEDGRPLDQQGAHVRGMNNKSVGIALAGGMNEERDGPEINFTDEQYDTLRDLLDDLTTKQFPDAEVKSHTDFDKGNCSVAHVCVRWPLEC